MRQGRRHRTHRTDAGDLDEFGLQLLEPFLGLMSLGKIADEACEHALLVTDSLTHRKLHGKGRTITPAGQHRSANADDPALAGGKIALEIAVMAEIGRASCRERVCQYV